MTKKRKPGSGGFGHMASARLREVSREAGRLSQELGVGHRWTLEEAKAAARKGALRRWKKEKK